MVVAEHAITCWNCGASLAALTLPFSRLDMCPSCSNFLHVCRQCEHFDPAVAEQCRHEEAEFVQDKRGANFCDWFSPSDSAFAPGDSEADRSEAALRALFGDGGDVEEQSPDASVDALNDLFRKDDDSS